MTLGVLGSVGRGRRLGSLGRLRGLGVSTTLVSSTIPGDCWDQGSFKTCHGTKWAAAAETCRQYQSRGELVGDDQEVALANCITQVTDKAAMADCGCQRPGTSSIYYGNSVKNPAVASWQVNFNRDLANLETGSNGKICSRISEDGKLGPGTAGAVALVNSPAPAGRSNWFPKTTADMALHQKITAAVSGKKATAITCRAVAAPVVVVPTPPPIVVAPPPVAVPALPPEKKSNLGLIALGVAAVAVVGGVVAKTKGWI